MVWDLWDGDVTLMGLVEGGGVIHGAMEHLFLLGDLLQRKMRFGFLKKKPISFEKS